MCVCLHVYGVYSCRWVWRPEVDWLSSSGILVNLTVLARHRAASPQNPHVSTSQHWDYRHAHPHLALYNCWKSELWSSWLYSKCFYHWPISLALLPFLFCIEVEGFLIQITKACINTYIYLTTKFYKREHCRLFKFSLCSAGAGT